MAKWKLKLNPGKAEAIAFRGINEYRHIKKWCSNIKLSRLNLEGRSIPFQNVIKYLGVTMTARPASVKHITRTVLKVKHALIAIALTSHHKQSWHPYKNALQTTVAPDYVLSLPGLVHNILQPNGATVPS